jgi:hypothetical protein
MAKFQSGHVLSASGEMLLQFVNTQQCDISFTALNPLISRFHNSSYDECVQRVVSCDKKAPIYDDRRLGARNQRFVFVPLEMVAVSVQYQ